MYSRTPNSVEINESFFQQLKPDCDCQAVFTTVCHDPLTISAVTSVYTCRETVVIERLSPHDSVSGDKYSSRYELYESRTAPEHVVAALLTEDIEQQKQSEYETPFSWHVEHAIEAIRTNDTVTELDGTYVDPERLDPPFDVPDDKPVAVLDISSAIHREIEDAQSYKVGLPIEIKRFRGKTYLIGITNDGCKQLSKACHEQKQEHKDMDFFEDVENADRAERIILNAEINQPEEANV